MPTLNYKPTFTVPKSPVKPKRKKPDTAPSKGIAVPRVGANRDSGIHIQTSLKGTKYRLWWWHDKKKRQLTLPLGVTLEQARSRRDTLHKNLTESYGAKVVANGKPRREGTKIIRLTQGKFIYTRPKYFVRIFGKQIGEAKTKWDAEKLLHQWIRDNKDKLPPGVVIEGLPEQP